MQVFILLLFFFGGVRNGCLTLPYPIDKDYVSFITMTHTHIYIYIYTYYYIYIYKYADCYL